jgi:hypothetical protein
LVVSVTASSALVALAAASLVSGAAGTCSEGGAGVGRATGECWIKMDCTHALPHVYLLQQQCQAQHAVY